MYYIGVDLGTSSVKLLMMDGSGKIERIVSREYPIAFPHPGWSEQDPDDWWRETKEGMREVSILEVRKREIENEYLVSSRMSF